MLCKGEKRARELRDSFKKITEDLEAEFLTVENAATIGTDRQLHNGFTEDSEDPSEEFVNGEGMNTFKPKSP